MYSVCCHLCGAAGVIALIDTAAVIIENRPSPTKHRLSHFSTLLLVVAACHPHHGPDDPPDAPVYPDASAVDAAVPDATAPGSGIDAPFPDASVDAAPIPVDAAPDAPPEGPPGTKAIRITFAGLSPGFVLLHLEGPGPNDFSSARCTSSCTTFALIGANVTALGYTPSTFGGWSGDCTPNADQTCAFGTVVADRAATVTFSHDEHEVGTLLPSLSVAGIAIAPDGDVLIGDSTGVTKMSPTGTVAWTTPIAGGARDLATDDAGNVLGAGGPGLFALSPAGALRWTRPVSIGANHSNGSMNSAVAVSPDGTVIAVQSGGVRVLDGNGNDRFAVTAQLAGSVAVGPDGTVAFPVAGPPEQVDVRRFIATGTELTTFSPLAGRFDAALAYDARGFLFADTSGHGGATVSLTTPAGSTVFSQDDRTDAFAGVSTGVGADSSRNLIAVRWFADATIPGLRLDIFSPTGARIFTHDKPRRTRSNGQVVDDGLTPQLISGVRGKRFAVAGSYGFSTPWIQIYDAP